MPKIGGTRVLMAQVRSGPDQCVRETKEHAQRCQRESIRKTQTDYFFHDSVPTELVPTCGLTAILLGDVPVSSGER